MSLGTLTLTLQANTSSFDRKLKKSKETVGALGDAMLNIKSRGAAMRGAFREIESGGTTPFNNLGRSMMRLKEVGGSLLPVMQRVAKGVALAGAAAAGAATAFTISSVKQAAEFEKTLTTFQTLLKSRGDAEKLVGDLRAFGKKSPFFNEDIFKAGKTLLASGFEQTGILGEIKTLGEVAAGTNSRIGDLALIFAEVKSKGKADLQDLKQFAVRGIPIFDSLRKTLSIGKEELRKLVSSGGVGLRELQGAFKDLTAEGGLFFGAVERQSKTLSGRWSTIVGNFREGQIAFGEAFSEATKLNGVLKVMSDGLGEIDWKSWGSSAADAFKVMLDGAILATQGVIALTSALHSSQLAVLKTFEVGNKLATQAPGSELARFFTGTGSEADIQAGIDQQTNAINERQGNLNKALGSLVRLQEKAAAMSRRKGVGELQLFPSPAGPVRDPNAFGSHQRITPTRAESHGQRTSAFASSLASALGDVLKTRVAQPIIQNAKEQAIETGRVNLGREVNGMRAEVVSALGRVERAIRDSARRDNAAVDF